MNNLMLFKGNEVEVLELNGQALFNPYHVGNCLDLAESSVRNYLAKMNNKQAIKVTNSDVQDKDIRKLNNAGEKFLTESGVYKLVFKSNKPNAEEFTDWIADEVLPSIRKTGTYSNPKAKQSKEDKQQVMLMNARSRMANTYLRLANVDTLSKEYKNILVAKASEVLAGEEILSLPKQETVTYSASDVGKILGISSAKVGRIANANNMKTDEYGEFYRDKSRYSSKEVDTFRYNDNAINRFKEILVMAGE